jgi:hypothetical protein
MRTNIPLMPQVQRQILQTILQAFLPNLAVHAVQYMLGVHTGQYTLSACCWVHAGQRDHCLHIERAWERLNTCMTLLHNGFLDFHTIYKCIICYWFKTVKCPGGASTLCLYNNLNDAGVCALFIALWAQHAGSCLLGCALWSVHDGWLMLISI